MRILVTGSSGYIARFLMPRLSAEGHALVGLDRRAAEPGPLERFVQGDLLDAGRLEQSLQGIEGVVHLAAAKADWGLSAEEYFRDNLEATRLLLDAGVKRGIKDWIFYSTVGAMGPSQVPIGEDAPLSPIEPYGASKAEAEKLFREYSAAQADARILILRPSVVFGPENPASTNIYRLTEALLRRRFVMVGDGSTIKMTSYIQNLVEVTRFLMERMRPGLSTYIYVDEPPLSTGELIRKICRLLDRKPPRLSVPLGLASALAVPADLAARILRIDLPITSARIQKFCRSTVFDGSKVRREGFQQPVDIDSAIQATVEWHLKTRRIRQ